MNFISIIILKCGDIVEVLADKQFPCDLLLVWTSSKERTCHITTANLDGETNLKIRRIQNSIPSYTNVHDLNSLRGAIVYDKPNPKLYEFKGKIVSSGTE